MVEDTVCIIDTIQSAICSQFTTLRNYQTPPSPPGVRAPVSWTGSSSELRLTLSKPADPAAYRRADACPIANIRCLWLTLLPCTVMPWEFREALASSMLGRSFSAFLPCTLRAVFVWAKASCQSYKPVASGARPELGTSASVGPCVCVCVCVAYLRICASLLYLFCGVQPMLEWATRA